jgi:hypothetical protein
MLLFRMLPTLVALTCCSVTADAEGLVGRIAGKSLDLVTPDGFCALDLSNSADSDFFNTLSRLLENSGNRLMQAVVNCDQLRERRRSRGSTRIYDYLVYYYVISTENQVLDGDRQARRKAVCDDLRQQGDASVADAPKIVERTAVELKKNMAVGNVKVIGVLAEDTHGCFLGLLANYVDKGGSFLMNITLSGTVIRSKQVYFSLYSKYVSSEISKTSLGLAQTTAAAFDSKNPE